LKNSFVRFNLATGTLIGMPGVLDKPFESPDLGYYIFLEVDRHATGLWVRANSDYVLAKTFFVNLFSEFLWLPSHHTDYLVYDWYWDQLSRESGDVRYGYQLTVEAEPHLEIEVARGMQLKAGLPVTYVDWPAYTVNGLEAPNSDGYRLSLGVRVGLFFHELRLPIEVEVGYACPLAAKHLDCANHAITFQLKATRDSRSKSPWGRP
jgi:hypothetical protein